MTKNLWGDLSSLETVRTPKTILEEQANLLTDATGGVLVGEVTGESQFGGFCYNLDVLVPALNRYSYTILTVKYSVDAYPVTLTASRPLVYEQCGNEEELMAAIEKILSSRDVRSALSTLKSQVS